MTLVRGGSGAPRISAATVDEPDNSVNPRAILVSTRTRVALGWVPNMLVDYVHEVRDGAPFSIEVTHVNGPDAPII
jgi:hypothetical protein